MSEAMKTEQANAASVERVEGARFTAARRAGMDGWQRDGATEFREQACMGAAPKRNHKKVRAATV
jgi:hypothetical protein